MTSCIYAGSFDPLHYGHLDVIINSCKIFDKVYVAPSINKNKKERFTIEERIKMIEISISKIIPLNEKVEIVTFDGMLLDYVRENNIDTIIKGVRNTNDFINETEMANAIRLIDDEVKTLFFPASSKYMSISSTIVYDVLKNKGNLEPFVPKEIIGIITGK